jgi:selT/selW/selH-like putative selenoprotein
MVAIFLAVAGGFFEPIRNHRWFQKLQDNKWLIILGAFMGLNFLKGILEGTGAYEVYFNGELIFSKLQTGRMPELHEILSKLNL